MAVRKLKHYKTPVLDIAAYLFSKGNDCEIQKLGINNCIYTFNGNAGVCRRLAKEYMTGKARVNAVHFMASRTALKNRAKFMPFPQELDPVAIYPGMPYYYKDDGKIRSATFAEKEPHLSRLRTGNFFKNKIVEE